MKGIVRSSYGDIIISLVDGEVIHGETKKISPNANKYYIKEIKKFDLIEHRAYYGRHDTEFDILDIGYWMKNEEYIYPCCHFRAATENW